MKALIIEDEVTYSECYKVGLISSQKFSEILIANIEKIKEKDFESALQIYGDNDFFVIDINLSNIAGCNLGIQFLQYLKSNKKDFKYLIVSEWNLKDIKDSEIVDPKNFINKRDYGLGFLLSLAIELKTKEICGK